MRRSVLLLFFLQAAVACGTKHPPENAYRIAGPGEPCYTPPHPWDDPPAGMNTNTANLPQCGPHFDTLGDRPLLRLFSDAGTD